MNRIFIEGDESGELKEFKTLWDAYRGMKEIKEFDKHNGIKDTYHYIFEYVENDNLYQRELKITVRKGKLTYKYI